MANQKFKDTLLSVLKADERLWQDGEFNQTRLFDLADKHDAILLKLLIDNEELKEKFFVKVNDIFIFKGQDFKFFLDENKLDNSYTQFENIIGLKVGNKMLKDRDEVVLNFPFTDCVLQGGQSRDEGLDIWYEYDEKLGDYTEVEAKRKEVFFNEILAKDEIDRLEAPKVLKNWKRYTKDGEATVWSLKRDEDGVIKENLIIKWNNLLALHSIKKEFAGKVKLVYIDPPYNTKSDSFKYNDNFNHSTWLTFMKNRLEVARELLRDDGVIFVQCDDNEQGYLKVLMDEVFWITNFVDTFIWKNTDNAPTLSKKVRWGWEFIHCFEKSIDLSKAYIWRQSNNDDAPLLNSWNSVANLTFPKWIIHFNIDDGSYKKWTYDRVELLNNLVVKGGVNENPIEIRGEFKWNKKMLDEEISKWTYFIIKTNKFSIRYQRKDASNIAPEKFIDTLYLNKAIWIDTNEDSKKEIRSLWIDFPSFPKPESLIMFLVRTITSDGDIILDYHLWSWTTAAVAHKMKRQYIGIEQMDYIETVAVERMKKVISGEQGGISKAVNWRGGGEFVYFELAEWNEEAKKTIQKAGSIEELEKFFDTMYERYFLNYNVKVKEFKEKVLIDAKFRSLPLDRQKDMFIRMLDLNQMYVNYTERNDKKFGISGDDISLSEEFYKN